MDCDALDVGIRHSQQIVGGRVEDGRKCKARDASKGSARFSKRDDGLAWDLAYSTLRFLPQEAQNTLDSSILHGVEPQTERIERDAMQRSFSSNEVIRGVARYMISPVLVERLITQEAKDVLDIIVSAVVEPGLLRDRRLPFRTFFRVFGLLLAGLLLARTLARLRYTFRHLES